MQTVSTKFTFKPNTNFQVTSPIGSLVSYFITAKEIRTSANHLGPKYSEALQLALTALENMQTKSSQPIGVSGRWNNFDIQLDLVLDK